MVKNTCGGNKHKGQARKVVMAGRQGNNALRIMEEEGEVYAQVVKIYGGPLCSVLCIDNVTRNCMIRGKFRNKRDCILKPGTWILVGLRLDMSVKSGAVETCDLLEVYNDSEKERLKGKQPNLNWRVFVSSMEKTGAQESELEFTDDIPSEYEELLKNELKSSQTKSTVVIDFGQEEEVNIDDI